MKKHKSKKSVQKVASSGNAEVFVLSPEILAKLGINIQTSQVADTNLVTDLEQDPGKTLQNGKPESSIIETASLMKESVFLSPTFNDNTSNVLPEVPEPISEAVSSQIINNNVEYFNSTNTTDNCLEDEVIHHSTDDINSIESNNDTQIEHTNYLGPCESIEEYQVNNEDGSLVLTEVSCENTLNFESCNEESRIITPFKEDVNKSLTSFNANNISENVIENMHYEFNNSDLSNKVKIISEEVIVDLSQLQKVTNIKLSNNATLIPITVDTVVTGKPVQNEFHTSKYTSPSGKIVDQLIKVDNLCEADTVQSHKLPSQIPEKMLTCPITKDVNDFRNTLPLNKEPDIVGKILTEPERELETESIRQETTASVENSEDVSSKNIRFENKLHNKTETSQSMITAPVESNDNKHWNGDTLSNENVLKIQNKREAEYKGDEEYKEAQSEEVEDKLNDLKTTMQLDSGLDVIKKIPTETETKNLKVFTTDSVKDSEDVLSKNMLLENKSQNDDQSEIPTPLESNDNVRCHGDTKNYENIMKTQEVNNTDITRDVYTSNKEQNLNEKPSDAVIETQSGDNSAETPDIEIDKVKEIASYLKQIATLRRKSKSERKIEQSLSPKTVKKLDNTQIEEDGEDQHKTKFGRTYQRTAIHKQLPAPIPMTREYADLFQIPNDLNFVKDNTGNISGNNNCVCYDFGNLSYYDGEMLYEHIHYRENKSTKSDAEIVYSIYNDHIFVYKPTEYEDGYENLLGDDETITDNICWNDFATETSADDGVLYTSDIKHVTDRCIEIEIDIMKPMKSISSDSETKNEETEEHIKSKTNTVKGSRKRSQSIGKTRHSVSESKTTVECGVCNKLILDTEWETHKEKEHDCIAWKAGEDTFDFNNDILMQTISQRLKVVGSFICPICKTKMKQLKKFTQHVGKCIKRKKAGPSPESSSPTRLTRRSLRTTTMSNKESDSPASVKLNTSKSEKDMPIVPTSSLKKSSTKKDSQPIQNEKLPACMGPSYPKTLTTFSKKNKRGLNMDSEIAPKNIKLEVTDPIIPSNESQSNETIDELSSTSVKNDITISPQQVITMEEKDSSSDGGNTTRNDTSIEIEIQGIPISDNSIECGVCYKSFEKEEWSDHLFKEHEYLAWRKGDPELNMENEEQVKNHLQRLSKQLGGLVCSKCGLTRKFAKQYLSHVKKCKDGLDESTASGFNTTLENDEDDEALSVVQSRKSRKRKSMPTQDTVVCGVCKTVVSEKLWIKHIQTEHKYLAWRDGEKPINLNSEDEVKSHLNDIAKIHGLVCNKCSATWRYVKKYLLHDCTHSPDDVPTIARYECGVCHGKGNLKDWRSHAMKVHYNLAWMADQAPLDLKDPDIIEKCLGEYKLEYNFICNKCKTARATISDFYVHIMTCGKTEQEIDAIRDKCKICGKKYIRMCNCQNKSMQKEKVSRKRSIINSDAPETTENTSKRAKSKGPAGAVNIKQEALQNTQDDRQAVEIELNPLLKCGVCKADVVAKDWINHIQREHAYLAWIEGEEPLDTENSDHVRQHLIRILNSVGELVCNKCGISRKNEHSYRQHIPACDKSGFKLEITVPVDLKRDQYECGVCNERGPLNKFKDHAMKKHYNIAWLAGDIPLNVKNFYAVEKYLKEYRAKYSLVCKECNTSRASAYGFYAHILQCGKSKQELEEVHSICDICNNSYLCIYRNQHMAMHREQNYKKDLKMLQEQKKAEERENYRIEQESLQKAPKKRKAAVKATGIIRKHSTAILNIDGKIVCTCGATFSNEQEQSMHKCRDDKDPVKEEVESSDSDSDIDSSVSDDEENKTQTVKVRTSDGVPKVSRMPYRPDNYIWHLQDGYKDFCKLNYTTDILFEEWRNTEYSLVPKEDIDKYLPPLKESCQIKFGNSEWKTCERFKSTNRTCIFTGGTVQCLSWAPPQNNHELSDDHYLCVASHRDSDVPRCSPTDRGRDQAMLQIWSFGNFSEPPQLSVALALDYGIIWAVDWCPSGARDPKPELGTPTDPPTVSSARLGLLAVACSDGSAYIFAVPYPTQETEIEKILYKLRPVAELRIAMSASRRIYQATAINWSHQQGHKIIIVGYSDGTTALYDLNTESPLLRGNENGVNIFYPFEDKLSESSAITGTVLVPAHQRSHAVGSVCSASVTGGTLRTRASSVRCHLAAAAAAPAPLWPAVVLYSDGALTAKTVTEVEWSGGGRRLGSARCGAACNHCGRLASVCSPAIRILRSHPIYPEIKKLIVATLIMVPFNKKSKLKKVNDGLSMLVEPLTYEETVAKYGLELSYVDKKRQNEAQKLCNDNENIPERFPLSEIISCAFCPSIRNHEKLALGTHAGLVFIINS